MCKATQIDRAPTPRGWGVACLLSSALACGESVLVARELGTEQGAQSDTLPARADAGPPDAAAPDASDASLPIEAGVDAAPDAGSKDDDKHDDDHDDKDHD